MMTLSTLTLYSSLFLSFKGTKWIGNAPCEICYYFVYDDGPFYFNFCFLILIFLPEKGQMSNFPRRQIINFIFQSELNSHLTGLFRFFGNQFPVSFCCAIYQSDDNDLRFFAKGIRINIYLVVLHLRHSYNFLLPFVPYIFSMIPHFRSFQTSPLRIPKYPLLMQFEYIFILIFYKYIFTDEKTYSLLLSGL